MPPSPGSGSRPAARQAEKPRLSLVIPAYNERQRLPRTLAQARAALATLTAEAEILVVDDGSTDDTSGVAREAGPGSVPVRVLRLSENRGKGAAVAYGVREARHPLIAFTDADSPYDLSALTPMMNALTSGTADVAIGARDLAESQINRGYGLARYVSGQAFSLLTQHVVGLPFPDSQCGLKAFRREAARQVFAVRTVDGFGFDFEILAAAIAAGYRIARFPVRLTHNDDSRIRLVADSAHMAADVFRVRRNLRRGAYDRLADSAEPRPCPLCGGDDFTPRAAAHGFRMVECTRCRLWYLNPMPTDATLDRLYGDAYFASDSSLEAGYADYASMADEFHATFRRRLELLRGYGGRLLDVGAGFGYLADVGRDRFSERWALERSEAAARRIAGDHRVVVGSFESADLPERYFDVVSMQDCLEHLPDPRRALERVRRLLRPGGAFLATTPDVESWLRRAQGRHWVSLKFPEHVVLYSRRTLRRALERAGFRVATLEPAGQYARLDFLASRLLAGHPRAGELLARGVRRLGGAERALYVPSGSLTVVATCEP